MADRPPPDGEFLAALHRALTARAARLGLPDAAAQVARDGDVLCRLLDGWLTDLPLHTAGAVTVYCGPGGACKLYGLPDPHDTD